MAGDGKNRLQKLQAEGGDVSHPPGASRPYEVCGTDCAACRELAWWEDMKMEARSE